MKRSILAGAAAAAVLAVPALAVQQKSADGGARSVTRAETQAKVQAMFARADSNRDGFVAQAEAQALAGQGRGKLFERFDSNRDGSVTRAEAEAVAARADGRRGRQPHSGLFARLDANGDGIITRAEFDARAADRAKRMQGVRGAVAARMFARLDSDRDGRLTAAEVTARSLARFDRIDLNRDGTLTPEERRAHRAQRRAKGTSG